jgi:hypothetical protein
MNLSFKVYHPRGEWKCEFGTSKRSKVKEEISSGASIVPNSQ